MHSPCPVRFATAFRHRMPDGYHCGMHLHPNIEIIYHAGGRGHTVTEGGRRWDFQPGTVVVHLAREPHEQWSVEGGADHCLQVIIDEPESFAAFDSFCIPMLQDRHARRELLDIQSWVAGSDAVSQRILDLRVSSVLLTLWREYREGRAAAAGDPGGYWAAQARRLILEQVDSLRTVDDLARQLGISADHLRHVCRQRLGLSPKQLMLETRLERAQDLLRHSPSTLDEIADLTGFANARQMCTTFRQRTGQSPGAYRRDARKRSATG